MTHAPKFWADKLTTPAQRTVFWCLVTEWAFSGETAYYKALAGETAYRRA
jgi:hypothetical protein